VERQARDAGELDDPHGGHCRVGGGSGGTNPELKRECRRDSNSTHTVIQTRQQTVAWQGRAPIRPSTACGAQVPRESERYHEALAGSAIVSGPVGAERVRIVTHAVELRTV
jgi:hypothetical protein